MAINITVNGVRLLRKRLNSDGSNIEDKYKSVQDHPILNAFLISYP